MAADGEWFVGKSANSLNEMPDVDAFTKTSFVSISMHWCKIDLNFSENREGLERSELLFKRLLAVNNIESDLKFWKKRIDYATQILTAK